MSAKILIVEDDDQFTFLLTEQLRDGQYETLHAPDGEQALRLLQEQHADLVLLDLLMPHMDGWETLRRMREVSDVPIIVVSCVTNEVDKARCLQMGADDYITKPVSRLEGMARIAATLRRGSLPLVSHSPVQIDERLAVDHSHHDAYVDGQAVNLSAIEYKLLAALLENAGRICTPRRLLADVWGWEYVDELNYLKVYIHYLRVKIEPEPAHPRYILTERGKGYVFQMPPRG